MTLSLNELDFRDLYISTDPDVGIRYNPKRSERNKHLPPNAPIPLEYNDLARELQKQADEKCTQKGVIRKNFALQLANSRVRGIRTVNYDDHHEYCFRHLPEKIPQLEELNYSYQFLSEMMTWHDRKGLILVMGPTGSGKTTLIMSYLSWILESKGGVIYTIEDPVEYLLPKEGPNFKTIQREAITEDDWPEMVNDALRYCPDVILCGEIRTPITAAAVLNLSLSGHQVIASIHGKSATAGLERLLTIASDSSLGDAAKDSIGDALICSSYQEIVGGKPNNSWLPVPDNTDSTEIRNAIKSNDLKMLPGIQDRLLKARNILEKTRQQPEARR